MNGSHSGNNGDIHSHLKRPAPVTTRRLLGETRRETVLAAHLAISRSKRRRLSSEQNENEDEDEDENENEIKEVTGSGALGDDDVAVFADAVYEKDDIEADLVYEQVEKRMESRRQKQRDKKLKEQIQTYRYENPTVKQQFADLREGLGEVKEYEWEGIPDIGDYRIGKEKVKKFTPAPDSLLESAKQERSQVGSVQINDDIDETGTTDLAAIGKGRSTVLEHKLDDASDLISNIHNNNNKNTIDHDGYLAAITENNNSSSNNNNNNNNNNNTNAQISTDIGDVKRMRKLLTNVTLSNPKHGPGWIALCRLEEKIGKISQARRIILQGCKNCTRDEEVWIEASRVHPKENSKKILSKAIRYVSKSEDIWINASTLEIDRSENKKRILRKGLEIIPKSEKLWIKLIEMENNKNIVKELLKKATECIKDSVKIWLAFARVEDGIDNIKRILNDARENVKGNINDVVQVWVAEAQMEEERDGEMNLETRKVIKNGVKSMMDNDENWMKKREIWMKQCEIMEQGGYKGTVRAIVCESWNFINDNNKEEILKNDAKQYESKGFMEIARSIWFNLTELNHTNIIYWREFVEFEKRQDSSCEEIEKVIKDGIQKCKDNEDNIEILWLMLGKHIWKEKGIEHGRIILKQALQALPKRQGIWIACSKMEIERKEYEEAREILKTARSMNDVVSGYVYMKSALLERLVGNGVNEAEYLLVVEGLNRFDRFEKLWLMLAQWFERVKSENQSNGRSNKSYIDRLNNPKSVYIQAIEKCPKSIPLWIGYSRLEENNGLFSKSRVILERARSSLTTGKDIIWKEQVNLEMRRNANNKKIAMNILSRGLKECPKSGKLWSLSIHMEEGKLQKSKSVQAVKQCGNDIDVITQVGKYLWRCRKFEKARDWFKRAIHINNGEYGDSWAIFIKFESELGNHDVVKDLHEQASKSQLRYGDVWTCVRKNVGNELFSDESILKLVVQMAGKEKF